MIKKEWFRYHYEFTKDELKEVKLTEFLIELEKKDKYEIDSMLDCLVNIIRSTRKMYDSSKPDNDFIEQTMLAAEMTFMILFNYEWKNGFMFKPMICSVHDDIVRKRGISRELIRNELEEDY